MKRDKRCRAKSSRRDKLALLRLVALVLCIGALGCRAHAGSDPSAPAEPEPRENQDREAAEEITEPDQEQLLADPDDGTDADQPAPTRTNEINERPEANEPTLTAPSESTETVPETEEEEIELSWPAAPNFPPDPSHWIHPEGIGTGAIEIDDDLSIVREVRIVEIAIQDDAILVRYVLLDGAGWRIVFRSSQQIRYEIQFEQMQQGIGDVSREHQSQGVYELRVAPDQRPAPCELQVILRFDTGTEVLQHWVDDWMYEC